MPPSPSHFYKYRAIANTSDPLQDKTLDALFNSYAVFSSRTSFNDLFDARIQLVPPSLEQLAIAQNYAETNERNRFIGLIESNELTAHGKNILVELEDAFNKLIDSYRFYCVSATSQSNLMWAHYADSHRGFCIEYRADKVPAEHVHYQDQLPQLSLSAMLPPFLLAEAEDSIGYKVWQALRTKLSEWSYEQEYRINLSREASTAKMREIGSNTLASYDASFVEAIIFGRRMPSALQTFITDTLPYPVKFKKAIAVGQAIHIVDA